MKQRDNSIPRPRTTARLAKIRRVLEKRQPDLTLVLANIHDPHNVSAIYRSCDAFGVPRVHLYYTDTAFPVLGEKSSASARKWVETRRHKDAEGLRRELKEQGMRIYATSCSEAARSFWDCDLSAPTAIILGNEHSGVTPELASIADGEIYIPMLGMIQSLNVSVAAAVLLAEASRRRGLSGNYDRPGYPDGELEELFRVWSSR